MSGERTVTEYRLVGERPAGVPWEGPWKELKASPLDEHERRIRNAIHTYLSGGAPSYNVREQRRATTARPRLSRPGGSDSRCWTEDRRMPSALDVEAATPKCGLSRDGKTIIVDGVQPCGKRLSFVREFDHHGDASYWECPDHGLATTVQSLVHRQGELAAPVSEGETDG